MDSKYEIIIYCSVEDEAFVAEVPELPGCMADGRTYGDVLENVQRVILTVLRFLPSSVLRLLPSRCKTPLDSRPL
jgi:predicted RNase H-like HicB family nuclease